VVTSRDRNSRKCGQYRNKINMQSKPYIKSIVKLFKPAFIIAGLICVIAIYEFVSSPLFNNFTEGVNFIQDKGWSHFPGAEITLEGIHFKPLGRIIIHQDGSAGQPNPPVNINGQHLKVIGDFIITATLSKIDKTASFKLYSTPPIVYDQWRYEPPSIDINVDAANNYITARIWDGTSGDSMDMRIFKVSLTAKTTISIEHKKGQINISMNNNILGDMPDHNIFSSGEIWFGMDCAYGGTGFMLTALDAYKSGTGLVEAADAPTLFTSQSNPYSLRNLADVNSKKIKIGSTVAFGRIFTDEQYRKIALEQFSMITPENSMKPSFIHPQPDIYIFEEADSLVGIALDNKMVVHGHTLIYDKSTPDWMKKNAKEQRQKIMISHIKNVVGHFKGKITEWDVVNEPFSEKNDLYQNGGTGLESNLWFEEMGEEYIDIAFKTAHEADPSAKLYLNDFGSERNGQHWDALLSLVKRLIQRGVPIDGVGFEAHIYGDGDYINPDQLKKHMEILDKLGLLTRISEIDVTGDSPKEQINQYVTALDVCLRAPNCTSYTTWGITDLYGSTTRSDRYPLVYGTSLLWDKNMKAKPAYVALQKRLQEQ